MKIELSRESELNPEGLEGSEIRQFSMCSSKPARDPPRSRPRLAFVRPWCRKSRQKRWSLGTTVVRKSSQSSFWALLGFPPALGYSPGGARSSERSATAGPGSQKGSLKLTKENILVVVGNSGARGSQRAPRPIKNIDCCIFCRRIFLCCVGDLGVPSGCRRLKSSNCCSL